MSKENERPIAIFTSESKIFERIVYDHVKEFIPFSRDLYGFRECYSTQHTLAKLIETCREYVDRKDM